MRASASVVRIVLVALLLQAGSAAVALAQGIDKGKKPPSDSIIFLPMSEPCGGDLNPCQPVADITGNTFNSMSRLPESGPYTYTVTVANHGNGSGFFEVMCQSPAQVPCSTDPAGFTLAKATSRTVDVTYSTKGIGSFKQTILAEAGGTSSSVILGPIVVTGTPIASHYRPLEAGPFAPGEELGATLFHSSGINPASFKVLIDGQDSTSSGTPAVITTTNLSKAGLNLLGGTRTWVTYGCAVNGRCDTVKTTFTALGPPTVWSLDDSLPPPQGHGIEGLLGGLPLPPANLRGCPVDLDAPEIRLTSPTSFLSQPGSGSAPGGLVFAASVGMNDTVRIATATVDFKESDNKTCGQYGYLPYSSFDWSWWTGTDAHDSLWTGYPYSDSGELIALESTEAEPDIRVYGYQLASLGRVYGPNAMDLASSLPVSRAWARRPAPASMPFAAPATRGSRSTRAAMLPSPGAIKPSTFQLTLNGTLIVSGLNSQATGVTVNHVTLSGASVQLPASHTLLRRFDPAAPFSNSGGWNELVATISDSTGHTSSVRARFVQLDPGNVAPLALKPLRDFSKVDQGECAAVGIFQCGGVMLSYGIPTYVSRDRDRSVHLVYRSASQRQPTILPVQLWVPREQKAPDSVHVVTVEAGVHRDSARYAGTRGAVTGIGSSNLWEHADETRIVGSVLPAASSGNAAIRPTTSVVRQFYAGGPQEDTVSQEVVQLYLSDTLATRWGQGWQLAEVNRLVFGQTSQGEPAAIWLSGDGSYTIFREVSNHVWAAPPGETARMVRLGTVTNNARYVLYLESGASIGFGSHGWQVYTADLLGNLTVYAAAASGSGRLNSITDPTGNKIVFNHASSGLAAGQVTSIDVERPGSDVRVAEFSYDTVNGGVVMKQLKILRNPGPSDSTIFAYRRGTVPGAFVDSIIDPRSTTALPVTSKFGWDSVTYTPEQVRRPPGRLGAAVMLIRDQWRRAVPRIGYGRFSGGGLERMVYPNQLRGTVISFGGSPTDFRVDRFGNPTWVSVISDGQIGAGAGGFLVPGSTADEIRDIERDTLGRVVKIVHGRNVIESADSVMYQYDALNRVQRMIRNTAAHPVVHVLDTVSFTYDSVTLASNGAWCSRLLTSTDAVGGVTSVGYGSTGVARCLPTRMVGLAADTTLFTYGPLTAGNPAGVRPVKTRDPVGLTDSVSYDASSWNTAAHVRLADTATSRAYYNVRGFADSLIDAEGAVTRMEKDRSMRVIVQRTGSDSTSPTVRTTYGTGGLVLQTDIYRSLPDDMATAVDTIQSTRNYFDRLGQLDSTIVPGVRTAGNKAARIQSFLRDGNGVPNYEFPGNGTYIVRIADRRGRLLQTDHSGVDYTRSVDGERFADSETQTVYNSFGLVSGANLSNGQTYGYQYDNKGRPIVTVGKDSYLGSGLLTQRLRDYSRRGALVGDKLILSDGATMLRHYQYNRRGQRTLAADTILVTGVTLGSEATGLTTYHYDSIGRLDSMVGASGAGLVGRARWQYDRAGRDTLMGLALDGAGAGEIVTIRRYDSSGRSSFIETRNNGSVTDTSSRNRVWYQFAPPSSPQVMYDKLDNLRKASGVEPDFPARTYEYDYSTDGAGRLVRSESDAPTKTITYNWVYDVFGNKRTETYGNTGATSCVGTAPMDYGADNRLLRKHTFASCTSMSRYWTDQTGNRLAETDSLTDFAGMRSVLSYTAANQLYFSITPTAAAGTYDYNWHWYDGDGRRVISKFDRADMVVAGPGPNATTGSRQYYMYDGDDVAVVLARGGSTWFVRQRVLSGGLDRPLATRLSPLGAGTQNMAFIADRQGTTLAAVRPDGRRDETVAYFGRNIFGRLEGAEGSGSSANAETGFTGASTPNQTGGFTYLRNRWYDPQSGRFLTQDPIGLAGGVNLYAYAGNNPVAYTDPFGLCPDKASNGSVCIDLFIKAKQVGPFRGDGRGFNPKATAAESRVQIVAGPGGKGITTTVSPSCVVGAGCAAPRSGGNVTTAAGEGGSFTVQFDGFKNSTIPYGASPDIDGQVTFTPGADGSYTANGNITAFPSNAVYQRVDGQWVELHRHTETTPTDLIDGRGRDQF